MNTLKSQARRLYRRAHSVCRRLLAGITPIGDLQRLRGRSFEPAVLAAPARCRFLSNQTERTKALLHAAQDYVNQLERSNLGLDYLYEKPMATYPAGQATFYSEVYQVLNLLEAMEIPCGGRIVEVGSGPGWVTEILLGLGYEVDGIEPCADMIRIAQERISARIGQLRRQNPTRIAFHCETLEETKLPGNHYDAVFFHASLHHVIDEEKGFSQCFRMLRPGGVLGVSEGAWIPGDRSVEGPLEEEMARCGTLENPFTTEYLDYLLQKHGFVDMQRYHGINGLVPVELGDRTVRELARLPGDACNTLTARKPGVPSFCGPTTADPNAETRAEITILEQKVNPVSGKITVRVKAQNCGKTAWLKSAFHPGGVTLAIYQGSPGGADCRELTRRQHLPARVLPGDAITMEIDCFSSPQELRSPWFIDLVSEKCFWFSSRGTTPARIDFSSHAPSARWPAGNVPTDKTFSQRE